MKDNLSDKDEEAIQEYQAETERMISVEANQPKSRCTCSSALPEGYNKDCLIHGTNLLASMRRNAMEVKMIPDRNELSPEDIVKRKTELAYQTYYFVIQQATEDLKKKLEQYGSELSSLR